MRILKKWTKQEIIFLKDNYKKLNSSQIQFLYFPCRTKKSIQRKLYELNFRKRKKLWTKKEIKFLKKNYGKMSTLKIAERIDKSINSVYSKTRKLGLKNKTKIYFKIRNQDFSYKEDKIIKKYWNKLQARQIKEKFSIIFKKRTLNGIRHRAERLNLKSKFLSNFGKLNGNYKHGKSREPYPLGWNNYLKEKIRQRDKKCMICNLSRKRCNYLYDRDLIVHHIDGTKKNLTFFNLISLCLFCHVKIQHFQEDLVDFFHAELLGFLD